MEGVTGTMAGLGHVPGCSRAGRYGPANIDFRFVYRTRAIPLQRAERHTKSHRCATRGAPRDGNARERAPPRVGRSDAR